MKKFFLFFFSVVLTACYLQAQPQPVSELRFHESFVENFDGPTPAFFTMSTRAGANDDRYSSGINSQSETGTNIMLLKIDPKEPAGPENGPVISSKWFTHYGTYTARVRIPDVTKIQPNVGAVVSFYTYQMDNIHGISKFGIEWLIANPTIICFFTSTGSSDKQQRFDRVINLANGIVFGANQPETVRPVENYNAASQFYTYGFDWYPDRIVWWMNHPITEVKTVLWEYKAGSTPGFEGVPVNPAHFLFNFRHSNDLSVEINRNAIEAPINPYTLEIDWMSYTPFDDLNKAYQQQNK